MTETENSKTGGKVVAIFISSTRDPEDLASLTALRDSIAMPPEAVAETIAFAIAQPATVDIGELVVRSTAQP
jgi:NADP-dependent 3-hydroxy acid dehydrogenase YdfG